MKKHNISLTLAILSAISINIIAIPPSLAQIVFEPPGEGKPKTSAGGASRGIRQCLQDMIEVEEPLVTTVTPPTVMSLTTESHPTFLVYVPATSAPKAFFSIQDEHKNQHYQTVIPLDQTAGIISIKLPEDAPALEVGKNYKWSFVLMCDSLLRPDSPLVEEQVKRIEPNPALANQLETATPLESASLYGKAGIWYETISTLATLRVKNPNDSSLLVTWEKLLTSVGLQEIANEPIIN